ncbi:hypothetical protein GO988_15465 [Hymenobacter sp. HMF4947]|uniref:Uncharacterized protein n=1 Tax=Hymenobacter ginkgonis TaxID=2682976 RepID=A0A7K1THU6_9BACT|nr:hypothetical protein [Hymenobacter ginkgonis]MVN77731.1 hypothetical protein [Hymenobacter ginkgonis]
MTAAFFKQKWNARFQDNDDFKIKEKDLREFKDDVAALGGGATAQTDLIVSLSNGKTMGTLQSGDLIAAGTPFDDAFFRRVLVEAIYPTYATAGLSLAQSADQDGEVGESVANTLTANFYQRDAGALTAIRIVKNGAQISSGGTSSPFVRNSNVVRVLGSLVFQAFVSYGAGDAKLVPPANQADTRPPAVRNPDAPQAAETDLPSNQVLLIGYNKLFFGATAAAPADSATVRALPQSQLTNVGHVGQLTTGTSATRFAIALPPGYQLLNVTDVDNQSANVTAAYASQGTLSVQDPSGTPYNYTLYLYTAATPYATSARHLFTYGT